MIHNIVVINGYPRSGKDKFIEYANNNCAGEVFNISSIDPYKDILKIMGWDGETKDEKTRKALSELKRISIEYNSGPIMFFRKAIDEVNDYISNDCRNTIFVNIREPGEIQKFKDEFSKEYNFLTVFIRRDCCENPKTDADKNVEGFNYDYYIENNDSLKDLESQAIMFINTI